MFSIVIPTWNNLAFLQLAVDTIRRHSAHDHEILVHVNDGSDGTLAWVRAEGLKHTASADNIGICYAVNRVAALATQPYLVYLNDDMAVLPGWDRPLIATAQGLDGERFMLSATMIEPTETGNRCVAVADHGRSPPAFDESGLIAAMPGLARSDWRGATWPPTLVPTWMWSEVGGYSVELSPGMSSDNDFTMKLWHAGCRIFLGLGDSLVYHFACVSTGRIVKNNGALQFLRKWGVSQRDFDRIVLRRGESVGRGAGLVPRTLSRVETKALERARFKASLALRFK